MNRYIIYMADSNTKIRSKISSIYPFLLYGFTGVIIVLYSMVIYTYVRMQIDDSVRINYGGRLRMLTQKITKDVILYRYGVSPRAQIEDSISVFNESIHAITHGGSVPLNAQRTEFKRMSPMDDPRSHELLDRAIEEWDPFKYHVIQFLERKDDASYGYIIEHNEKLLDTIDRAVIAIQVHTNQDQRVLAIVITAGIAAIFVMLLYNFLKQVRRYRIASSRLAEIELLLPICANCKKIRTNNEHPFDPRSWTTIEEYLIENKDMICPDCMTKLYPNLPVEKDKSE